MRTALALVAFLLGAASAAAQCTLENATYRTADPRSDYELTFAAGDLGGNTLMETKLVSKAWKVEWVGDVQWTNGFSRPYISLSLTPDAEEPLYSDEIVALGIDSKKRIDKIAFPATSDPAPKAILLNQVSRVIYYWGRDTRDFDTTKPYIPSDMFWLSGCEK